MFGSIIATTLLCISSLGHVHGQTSLAEYDAWSDYEAGVLGQYPQVVYKSTRIASPQVHVTKWNTTSCDERNKIILTPHGEKIADNKIMMLDHRGNLVWHHEEKGSIHNVQVQQYRGRDMITFWVGDDEAGWNGRHGAGFYKMLDQTYTLTHTIAAMGIDGDFHDFSITQQNTALITAYVKTPRNLTDHKGGREDGYIWDCVFQEIEIESGRLLFEWRASNHFEFDQMAVDTWVTWTGTSGDPWDWFHLSSVTKDHLGNYLIAAQHTNAIHCISGISGKRLWQLGGGVRNSFSDSSPQHAATTFSNPQMARWESASADAHGILTVFTTSPTAPYHSQGLRIALDLAHRTASLLTTFIHPEHHHAQDGLHPAQGGLGSLQHLPESDTYFMSYGTQPVYSQFSATGELVCDAHFAPVNTSIASPVSTYRIHASHWTGYPRQPPVVKHDIDALYIHWNGATDLASWELEGRRGGFSRHAASYNRVGKYNVNSFETEIALPGLWDWAEFRLTARNEKGGVLGVWTVGHDDVVKKVMYDANEVGMLGSDIQTEELLLIAMVLLVVVKTFGPFLPTPLQKILGFEMPRDEGRRKSAAALA